MFMCQNENEQSQAASENLKKFTIATLCTMIEANRRGGVILHHLTISTPFVNIHIATIPTLSLRSSDDHHPQECCTDIIAWSDLLRGRSIQLCPVGLCRSILLLIISITWEFHDGTCQILYLEGRGEWISQFIPTQGSERTLSQHRWEGLVLLPCRVD